MSQETQHPFYQNGITLKRIKDELCPSKTNKDFVNLIFQPLKEPHQLTFTDTIGEKHLSAFVHGNHDNKKRLNIRRLHIWAENICAGAWSELLPPLDALAESAGVSQRHSIYQLLSLDETEMPDSLLNTIRRYIREQQHSSAILLMILWAIYSREQIDLLYPIYHSAPSRAAPARCMLLPHTKPCRPVFMGREQKLLDIHAHFSAGEHFLFLQGMGGIGKSECAKQYAQQYQTEYDTVIFAEYSSSLVNLINDNTVFTLTDPFPSDRLMTAEGIPESDEAFFRRKMTQLRLCADSRTLLILDNLDQYDEILEEILSLPCHILITARWQFRKLYPQHTILIDEIQNRETLREIFSAYYGRDIHGDANADAVIDLLQGHTMAIELVAKQMRVSCLSAAEMYRIMQHTDHGSAHLSEEFLMPNHSRTPQSLFRHMQKLFDIALLSDTERYVLECLSLLPLSGIDKHVFKQSCGLPDFSALNVLADKSWIRDLDGVLSMHTLVRETVSRVCAPDLSRCSDFIRGLMREYSAIRCYHADRQQKNIIEKIALHLYHSYPEPVLELFDFYEWAELVIGHCCHYVPAMELACALLTLYQNTYGERHFRTARMHCRIACCHVHFFNTQEAITLLRSARDVIKSLDNLSTMEELYVSDIDFTLSNQYLDYFEQFGSAEILNFTEEICHEMIAIRQKHRGEVKESLYVDCAVAYRNLARVQTLRGNYEAAELYLKRAFEECAASDSGFYYYFLNYAQAKLAMKQNDPRRAIDAIIRALQVNEEYFGKYDARSVKLNIELADLYLQCGEKQNAHMQYLKCQQHLEQMSGQHSRLLNEVKKRLEKLELYSDSENE